MSGEIVVPSCICPPSSSFHCLGVPIVALINHLLSLETRAVASLSMFTLIGVLLSNPDVALPVTNGDVGHELFHFTLGYCKSL